MGEKNDRFRGALLGLAVGDAIGTTVEFRRRGTFEPLTDMVGGGPFRLAPGQWTDDTSMALCLGASLVECRGFDARDQMTRYVRWHDEGYLSSNGVCFDIGNTVAAALRRFRSTGEPFAGSTDPRSAGNGCLMRLAPIPMWFAPDLDAVEHHAALSSRTTHGAAECVDASRLFARLVARALAGSPKHELLLAEAGAFTSTERFVWIAQAGYLVTPMSAIRGTGYVVDCLEAALWCFAHTTSFRDAVLAAANLGDDADTTAAVCGQIAGAFHGASAIPQTWLARLAMRDEITALADALAGGAGRTPSSTRASRRNPHRKEVR